MGGALAFAKSIVEATPASAGAFGSLEHWIDIEIVQKLVRHSISVIVAVFAFYLVGKLLRRLVHEGFVKRVILFIDDFVLFVLLAFLGWEIIALLLKRLMTGHTAH